MYANNHTVIFFEAFAEEETALRSFMPKEILAIYTWNTIDEWLDDGNVCPRNALVSIRTQSRLPAAWAEHILGVLSRSTGYDHLLRYAVKIYPLKLPLAYLPLYCNRAVAEQACLLWLSLQRRLAKQLKQFGTFFRDGLTGVESLEKTLLVVGVGNIGKEVVKIGCGLGMKVLGVDPVQKLDDLEYVGLDAGLQSADVIVCCMNLTTENSGIFSGSRLAGLPRHPVFVNVARGELSPAVDLLPLLKSGELGGVALDVFADEGPLAEALRSGKKADTAEAAAVLELAEEENSLLTPHNAFNSSEAVARKAEHSAVQVEHFLLEGCFRWNVPLA